MNHLKKNAKNFSMYTLLLVSQEQLTYWLCEAGIAIVHKLAMVLGDMKSPNIMGFFHMKNYHFKNSNWGCLAEDFLASYVKNTNINS